MSELTIRNLHAVMGELLNLLADVPGVDDPTVVTWDVGRQPGGYPALRVTSVGSHGPELLEAVSRLLGGEQRRQQDGEALESATGGWTQMTTLDAEFGSVSVQVTAWLPTDEPTADQGEGGAR